MRLKALLDVLAQNSAVSQVIDLASSRVRTDYTTAVVPGVRPALLAAMALGKAGLDAVRPQVNHPLLVVCATILGALGLYQLLKWWRRCAATCPMRQ